METYCRVLIVDDEMLVRQGIKHLLDWESEGFALVGEASNGKEALELIEVLKPNIMLTDMVMPVMNGEELTRRVKEAYPDIEIVVLSSYGEFEYVRSTFQSGVADYFLKPKLDAVELLTVLKKTARRIPSLQHTMLTNKRRYSIDYILEKLINGYPVDDAAAADLREIFPHPYNTLLAAEVNHSSGSIEHEEEWLETAIEDVLRNTGMMMISKRLPAEDNHFRFLLNTDHPGNADAVKLAEGVIAAGAKDKLVITFAISRNFTDMQELYEVYMKDVLKLLGQRFFLPIQRSIVLTALTPRQDEEHLFDIASFTEELNRQQYLFAFNRLRSYVQSLQGSMSTDVFEFKSFLGHTIFNVILALMRFHVEASGLDKSKYDYFRSIHESKHISEAIAHMERFLDEAGACCVQASQRVGSPDMQRILTYIEEHMDEPLHLAELAKHFHFNASYLSSYFTVHNKEGFNEYLNRVRIEKASHMLRNNPHLTISEISGLVGYSDHSYFTKVFRKLKGYSPRQFRKMRQEGD